MRFTFDIIHRDSFPKQILVRLANSTDDEGDIFESLEDVNKALAGTLVMDIFYSKEIIRNLFG
jgi:hypothetical protein